MSEITKLPDGTIATGEPIETYYMPVSIPGIKIFYSQEGSLLFLCKPKLVFLFEDNKDLRAPHRTQTRIRIKGVTEFGSNDIIIAGGKSTKVNCYYTYWDQSVVAMQDPSYHALICSPSLELTADAANSAAVNQPKIHNFSPYSEKQTHEIFQSLVFDLEADLY